MTLDQGFSKTTSRTVLADMLPRATSRSLTLIHNIALILSGTLFVAVASQIALPLPFTPVPLSLATFAVLLTGASLGPIRAGLSLGIYVLAGVTGVPVFADFTTGFGFPSFGYVIGYFAAAVLVGSLASRAADRNVFHMFATATLGTTVIYLVGAPYLALALDLGAGDTFLLGIAPFLIGDLVKALAAALLLPSIWRFVGKKPC